MNISKISMNTTPNFGAKFDDALKIELKKAGEDAYAASKLCRDSSYYKIYKQNIKRLKSLEPDAKLIFKRGYTIAQGTDDIVPYNEIYISDKNNKIPSLLWSSYDSNRDNYDRAGALYEDEMNDLVNALHNYNCNIGAYRCPCITKEVGHKLDKLIG